MGSGCREWLIFNTESSIAVYAVADRQHLNERSVGVVLPEAVAEVVGKRADIEGQFREFQSSSFQAVSAL